jgi:hypothetical protein
VKKYFGSRAAGAANVGVVDLETKCASSLDAGYRYVNHSPTGFEWGYGGSGPAQLAFALLLDFFESPSEAMLFYQDFKWKVIARILTDQWELSEDEILTAIQEIRVFRTRAHSEA